MTHVALDASADHPEWTPLAVLPDSTGILIEDRHVRSYAHRHVRLYADILARLLPRWRDDPISLAHLGAAHTGVEAARAMAMAVASAIDTTPGMTADERPDSPTAPATSPISPPAP